jgi:hypothetical protein
MRKQKTTMIEVTNDELHFIHLGLTLLNKNADKLIIKKRRQEILLLSQRMYKQGIIAFKWEAK